MDLSSANPNAHNDQEQFPVGDGNFVRIPLVAKAQSVTAASRRLQRGVEVYDGVTLALPQAEATAIASAVVDPSQLRNDLERKRVSEHRTPSGYTLMSVEARVWTAAVSPDGANGRGRLEVKLGGGTVWPLPEETDAIPSMRYHTHDVEHLREAVRDNAKRIVSPDLRQLIREHPGGVWNPIYLVPASAIEEDADEVEACGFVHTAEGSTRVVTCLEGLGVESDVALKFAGSQTDLVRRARAGVASRISVQPGNADVHYAAKVLTMPAHIIIGVLDEKHEASERPFPQVISEFVESIHEQPRPWNPIAQSGVRGERLVADLATAGFLAKEQANDIVGRDEYHEITTEPNVIAGRLLRAASHPDARSVARKAVLEDAARQHLTKKRYAQTVGSLLLPIYQDAEKRHKTMVPALTNEFQPPALEDAGWSIREDIGIPTLLEEALAALDASEPAWSNSSRELVARGITALTALGLVYSDQGSAVNEQTWLRGTVARVVNNLALCAGGLKTIAEAVEFMEGRQDLPPLLYDADGQPAVVDGEGVRLVAEQGANIKLRALAFRDAKPDDDNADTEDASPYDRFISLQNRAASTVAELDALVERLYEMRDDADQVLIDRHGLRRDIIGGLPETIIKIRDSIVVALEDETQPLDDPTDEMGTVEAIESAFDGLEATDDHAEVA
jgi:hypothetical protein